LNIAVIPARGGSKRIPRKNIKSFGGKPMIAYAIEAAVSSALFEHVLVSTDDPEIQSIAIEWGAETPFTRPNTLADDQTPTVTVMAHAITECAALGWQFSNVCCIYPCVPFLEAKDLKNALTAFEKSQAPYCFPVTAFPSAVQRALKQTGNGQMMPLYPEFESTRTQDLEPAFYDAGQFYWGKKQAWLSRVPIHSHGIGHVVPSWRVIDIDTPGDWAHAERMAASLWVEETP